MTSSCLFPNNVLPENLTGTLPIIADLLLVIAVVLVMSHSLYIPANMNSLYHSFWSRQCPTGTLSCEHQWDSRGAKQYRETKTQRKRWKVARIKNITLRNTDERKSRMRAKRKWSSLRGLEGSHESENIGNLTDKPNLMDGCLEFNFKTNLYLFEDKTTM